MNKKLLWQNVTQLAVSSKMVKNRARIRHKAFKIAKWVLVSLTFIMFLRCW